MDKNLRDDIDDFFSDHLKNYSEEPEKDIWSEIDKRLSEKQKLKFEKTVFLSAAAIIAACLLIPSLLHDTLLRQFQIPEIKLTDKKIINNKFSVVAANTKHANNNNTTAETSGNQAGIGLQRIINHDFSTLKIQPLYNKSSLNGEEQQLKNQHGLIFYEDDATIESKTSTDKAESSTAKLLKKHNVSISPFFSFDHITGRFIEQYKYDNSNEDDYKKIEKSDISFTSGLFAAYKLNRKFSIMSGLSVSISNLTIAATAVNALKDENGAYKFKLETSYGLAELSKSGITPAEGDSILLSGAALHLNYISVPLMINYNFGGQKIKLSAHSGIAFNKIISDKVEAEYSRLNNNELEVVNTIEGIKKTFFTLNAGIEAKFFVSRSIDVSISPELRYGINSINKGTPIKTYPINYGLGVHINLKL